MRSTRCLDLVQGIYESELSYLSCTKPKRTSAMCYAFQKRKSPPLEEEKGQSPEKRDPLYLPALGGRDHPDPEIFIKNLRIIILREKGE